VDFIGDSQSIPAKKLFAYSSISVEKRGIFVEFRPIRRSRVQGPGSRIHDLGLRGLEKREERKFAYL
jgi:hypothetical protein